MLRTKLNCKSHAILAYNKERLSVLKCLLQGFADAKGLNNILIINNNILIDRLNDRSKA